MSHRVVSYSIRLASQSDLSSIQACVASAYLPWIGRIGRPPGPLLDDYASIIDKHYVAVAQCEAEKFCAVLVLIVQDDTILLDNIAVDPVFQGQGVGSALVTHAEQYARSKGYDYIRLYTHLRMTENITLYRRLGYVDNERRVVNGYSRLYMVKALHGADSDSQMS